MTDALASRALIPPRAASTRRCYAAWRRSLSCRPIPQRMADGSRIEHPIDRASHGGGPQVQDVRVDHRGAHVTMPEQLLDGPDVAPSSSKCVANEWRSVCGAARFAM